MPNHVKNCLTVTGTVASLRKFTKKVIGNNGSFTFNSFIKMPKSTNDKSFDWYSWTNASWGTKWDAYETDILGEDFNVPNSHEFYTNWKMRTRASRWSYRKRIVKKNIDKYFDGLNLKETDRSDIYIDFQTAWCSPTPVFEAIGEYLQKQNLTDINIDVKYADEDIGSNCGSMLIDCDGVSFSDIEQPDTLFALEVWYGDVDPKDHGYDSDGNYIEDEDEDAA